MDIDAKSKTWSALVNSEDVKYFIPNYQRYYSWTRNKELPELWSDLITAFKNKTPYFMGTLLFAKKTDGDFDVVDGQQRMLSFTILFSVIRDYALLSQNGIISDSQLSYKQDGHKDKAKFVSDFIYDSTRTLQRSSDESYFVVANKDKDSFNKIINGEPELDVSAGKTANRMIKAKCFFQREIQQEFFNKSSSLNMLSEFQQFISKKIKFVSIVVEDEFDACTIFESLNSKGMDLSLADLLKNKILSSISSDNQSNALSKWNGILDKLSANSLSFIDYMRVYWCAYQDKNTTKSSLYDSIKKCLKSGGITTEFLLNELVEKVDIYIKIRSRSQAAWPKVLNVKNKRWLYSVSELNLLGYTIHLPFFMVLLDKHESYLNKIAPLTLNLLFKWVTICGFSIGEIEALFQLRVGA